MLDFKVISKLHTEDDKLKAVFAALKKLENTEVLVGIPADGNVRKDGDGVNNAELLYIHTHGSAIKNIPLRPVIEPSIEDDKTVIGELLGEAAKAAMDGNSEGVDNALKKAGMEGQNAARTWFTNPKNGWAANKNVKEGENKIPLIDTGEMRKSITHVVREK